MKVYVDTSVVLRVFQGQKNAWKDWGRWETAYSSALLGVECRRFLDRMRLEQFWGESAMEEAGMRLRQLERVIDRVRLSPSILERAGLPMPTILKTLDSIHLATAARIRERIEPHLVFMTHDAQQGRAARALGFECPAI